MYRSLLIGVVLALAATTAASADDDGWKGPGWYLTYLGFGVVAGPYANEADCDADKASRNDQSLSCENLDKDP